MKLICRLIAEGGKSKTLSVTASPSSRCSFSLSGVIDDQEVWACANLLMKRHGPEAWFAASRRADELLEQGEMAGYRTFLRILDRIKQLEAMEPPAMLH
ncbi:MAG: hypothetical protein EON59_01000 [Alphaproteobacteria bacterium]|nr:MAG: hypothetical protein EON59_01000 [Alphaproteobacteria bacterium]